MRRAKTYLRNLASNWVGYGINLVIMFAMSPFVIHRLGDVNYGIWSIMMSMTGYLGLVEIGTRGGLGRYINYYLAKNDFDKLNGVLNTALTIFTFVGLLLFFIALVIAVFLHSIFPKIPNDLIFDSRIVLYLITFNVWLSFFNAAFRQILSAYERFDLRNLVDVIVLVFRSGGVIVALLSGYGLVALGLIQTVASFLGLFIVYVMAGNVCPYLKLGFAFASKERFKELFGFSIWAFFSDLSYKLLFTVDSLVIGIVLGPKWVTYYSVGGMLFYRANDIVNQASSVFSPKIMQCCAIGDFKELRSLYINGSRLTVAVGILVFVGVFVFGHDFIILWMGYEFSISYKILAILISSSFFTSIMQVIDPVIYSGMHKVKLSAFLLMTQGVVNLGLSLFFVMTLGWGIEGVAWGTFYPRVFWSLISAAIIMKWINYEVGSLLKSLFRWTIVGSIFMIICQLIDAITFQNEWIYFFFKVLLVTVLYFPLVWFFLINAEERKKILFAWLNMIKNQK